LILFTIHIPSAYSDAAVKRADILKLLGNKEYERLDEVFERLQKSFLEHLVEKDDEAVNIYNWCFGQSTPGLEGKLTAWIAASPRSAFAYLARATYYSKLAWRSRGGKWAQETSEQQFSEMRKYFKKAFNDNDKAMQLRPDMVKSYTLLIEASSAMPGINARQALDKALSINPASYRIRSVYMTTLLPKWGGSLSEMSRFVSATKPYYPRNPRLKAFDGALSMEFGNEAVLEKNYGKAIDYFSEAAKYDELAFLRRGAIYMKIRKYEEAKLDFEHVLRKDPSSTEALVKGAGCYYHTHNYRKALDMATAAVKIDPAYHIARYEQGRAYWGLCDGPAALRAFQKAEELLSTGRNQQGIRHAQRLIRNMVLCARAAGQWNCDKKKCDGKSISRQVPAVIDEPALTGIQPRAY
jgi:tetratricopeptide (TPR) repeat protein